MFSPARLQHFVPVLPITTRSKPSLSNPSAPVEPVHAFQPIVYVNKSTSVFTII